MRVMQICHFNVQYVCCLYSCNDIEYWINVGPVSFYHLCINVIVNTVGLDVLHWLNSFLVYLSLLNFFTRYVLAELRFCLYPKFSWFLCHISFNMCIINTHHNPQWSDLNDEKVGHCFSLKLGFGGGRRSQTLHSQWQTKPSSMKQYPDIVSSVTLLSNQCQMRTTDQVQHHSCKPVIMLPVPVWV